MIDHSITVQTLNRIRTTLEVLDVRPRAAHPAAPAELRTSEPVAFVALTFCGPTYLQRFQRLVGEIGEEWGRPELACGWVWAVGVELPDLADDLRWMLSPRTARRRAGRESLRQHIGQLRRDGSFWAVGIPVRDLPLLHAGLAVIKQQRLALVRRHHLLGGGLPAADRTVMVADEAEALFGRPGAHRPWWDQEQHTPAGQVDSRWYRTGTDGGQRCTRPSR